MVKKERSAIANGKATAQKSPRCLAIAERGISTGTQYAELMSTLMTDLICGAVTPQIGMAVCNAGGKLLKIVELQIKYGKQGSPQGTPPTLRLIGREQYRDQS